MFNKDYNFLVRLLHYSIIGNKIVPELLFDIENFLSKHKNKSLEIKHHVYVTGLARAGTTILLNALYTSNQFASFTYRDMPFVISPNIWNYISKYLKAKKSITRGHNDNILINLDSPEQFEEIFWNLKTSDKYNYKEYLKFHEVDDYNLNLYELFIKNCLIKYNKSNYLCKNNNNLLRINSLIKKFPNAKFLISFRNPLDHSISLYKQNLNFINLQTANKFTKSYMNSLVHHEFGLNHKPFLFPKMNENKFKQNDINYWLEQWINFYNFIKETKLKENKNLIFIDYKELCENTSNELQKITNFIGEDFFRNIESKFFSLKQHETKDFHFDSSNKKKSLEIYNYLKN